MSNPMALRTKKAVSERLFSAAMAWRIRSSSQQSRRHTAAALPEKTSEVKASTWYSGILIGYGMIFSLRQRVAGKTPAGMNLVDEDTFFYGRITIHDQFYCINICTKDSDAR